MFNITLIAQNEYGLAAWMAILGVEIKIKVSLSGNRKMVLKAV